MKRKKILVMTLCLGLFLTPAVYAIDFGEFGLVDIHGFISQGYIASDNNNWMGGSEDGTWEYNEMGLNFTTMVTSRLRLGMQFFARDLAAIGNDEITLDWGYADYNIRDWLGIRIGQMKNPLGLYNETRDIDFLRTSVFLPQTLYNEGARDSFLQTKGIGLYGTIDGRGMGLFRYLGLYGTTDVDVDGGTGRLLESAFTKAARVLQGSSSAQGDLTAFSVDKTYTMSLAWQTPLEGLSMAGSFNHMEYVVDYSLTIGSITIPLEDFSIRQETWTASIEYSWYDLLMSAEILRSYAQKTHILGWYYMVSYRFTDWLTAGAYYGEYYPNDADKRGREPSLDNNYQGWTKTAAAFVRFDINENWLLKVEYQYNDGVGLLTDADNLNEAGETDFERYWDFVAAKITFNF